MQEHTLKEKLLDQIYITRKSRIWAAERYKGWDNLILIINIYYSALLIIFSIITFTDSTIQVDIFLISASILVFAFNAISMSQNFKETYFAFKDNYLSLGKLYGELERDKNNDKLSEYQSEYNKLLTLCQNHTTYDYNKMLLKDNYQLKKVVNSGKQKKWQIYSEYYIHKVGQGCAVLILVIAPFLMPTIIKLISCIIDSVN